MSGWLDNTDLSEHHKHKTTDIFVAPQLIPPDEIFVQDFSDGATTDMTVNGSVTAVDYRVTCPADKVLVLSLGEWHYADAGIEPLLFGGIAALANGVVVSVHDADDSMFASFHAITHNLLWSHLGAVNVGVIWQGATIDTLSVRWEMTRSIGYGIVLEPGQYVQTKIQDDLTALDHFEGSIHGRQIPYA